MSSLTVTSLENDATNPATLLYAISQANDGTIDSIVISSSLNGKTFDLSSLESLYGNTNEDLIAFFADLGIVSNLSGSITVESGGAGYGLRSSASSRSLKLSGFTGEISVTASGDAYGYAGVSEFGNYYSQAGSFTGVGLSGQVTVSSLESCAYGIYSSMDNTWSANGSPSVTRSQVSLDGFAMEMTVTAGGGSAYGIASRAKSRDVDSYNGQYHYWTRAESQVSLGAFTGRLSVSGSATAYGVYSVAETAHERAASGAARECLSHWRTKTASRTSMRGATTHPRCCSRTMRTVMRCS